MRCVATLENDLRIECKSQESGYRFITDGPKTIQGIGEAFTPTDLVGVALASCIVTMMAAAAKRMKVDLSGTTAFVDKKMDPAFSKIVALDVEVKVPHAFDEQVIERLKQAASACPVHHSLHPEIAINVVFSFDG